MNFKKMRPRNVSNEIGATSSSRYRLSAATELFKHSLTIVCKVMRLGYAAIRRASNGNTQRNALGPRNYSLI